jgi:hypothetical protein
MKKIIIKRPKNKLNYEDIAKTCAREHHLLFFLLQLQMFSMCFNISFITFFSYNKFYLNAEVHPFTRLENELNIK